MAWADKFALKGGYKFLIDIFNKPKELKSGKLIAMKEEALIRALDNLLDIKQEFGDADVFFRSLLESFYIIAISLGSDYKMTDSQSMLSSLSKLISNLNNFNCNLLENNLSRYSVILGRLFKVCLICPTDLQFSSNSIPIFEYLATVADSYIVYFEELNSQLDYALLNSTCDGYWDLLSFTIRRLEIYGETLYPLYQKIMGKVVNRDCEKSTNDKDYTFAGCLKVLTSLWTKVGVIPDKSHLKLFLHECLFEEPEKMTTLSVIPPKCKHLSTRESAFNLLIEISNYDHRFCGGLTDYLNKFHQEPD